MEPKTPKGGRKAAAAAAAPKRRCTRSALYDLTVPVLLKWWWRKGARSRHAMTLQLKTTSSRSGWHACTASNSRLISSAKDTFEFFLEVPRSRAQEASPSAPPAFVSGVLRYHPFVEDRETFPTAFMVGTTIPRQSHTERP